MTEAENRLILPMEDTINDVLLFHRAFRKAGTYAVKSTVLYPLDKA